jgi:hypothetical protein
VVLRDFDMVFLRHRLWWTAMVEAGKLEPQMWQSLMLFEEMVVAGGLNLLGVDVMEGVMAVWMGKPLLLVFE